MANPSTAERDLRRLAALGRKMREAQRSYFQQRTEGWLQEAKRWEREFDREVGTILADDGQQTFDFGWGPR